MSPATDPGRAAEEMRDRIARFLWDERYGHLPDASWDQALEIAEGIPDGLAASSLHEMRMRADRLLAGPLAKLIAQRDEVRGWANRSGNAARYWECIHAEKDKRLARAEAEAAQLRARLHEAEKGEARAGSEYADAMDARMEDAAQMDRLRIAFLVIAESGHGGGMAEVRRWFAAGATGPIAWPGGKLFEVWAAEHDIYDCNGAMGFRQGDRGRAA